MATVMEKFDLSPAAVRAAAEQAFDAGRYGPALVSYRRWLCLAPSELPAAFDMAATLRRLEQPAAAAQWFGRCRRLVPRLEQAAQGEAEAWAAAAQQLFSQAGVLMAAEKREAASAVLRRLLCVVPAAPEGWQNLAALLSGRFDWRRAQMAISRAMRLRRDDAAIWAQAGKVAAALARAADARPLIERALALAPTHVDALTTRAGLAADPAAALIRAERALRLQPLHPDALAHAAQAAEALGDDRRAAGLYRRLIAAVPGYARGFTGLGLLELRLAGLVSPPPRPVPDGAARLSFSRLGREGRFGNQLLQYAVGRLVAARQGLALETPPWVGRTLYDFDEPLCDVGGGPMLREDETGLAALADGAFSAAGRDLFGFFCGDVSPLAPHREAICELFTPTPAVAARLGPLRARLLADAGGETLVALHLRRGDFGGERFWIAPEAWYLDWLQEIWPTLKRPLLYLATDAPGTAAAFAAYAPRLYADVAGALPAAPYAVDHQLLRDADVLAISNSSFSYTAAMLNRRAGVLMRPDRAAGGLRPFNPWGEAVLL